MQTPERPKVGVGAIIVRNGKVLLGKRKNAHGEHTFNFPGGHLEYGESIEACAGREVLEETGLVVEKVKVGPFTNDIFKTEGKHYITIFAVCQSNHGEPKILEPDKCEGWNWYSWDKLPRPLFIPIQNLLKQNFNPIDASN
jgi:8-oxo-dGTP diphosphatase